ncbi:hypothetical protein BH11PSE1_BH11PSE1_33740 [soil metagenome]
MDYGLKGQVAIVTGSTSGIGHALAEALARQGVAVVLNGLGEAAAIEKTRADLEAATGVEVLYHPADMTKPAEIADMVAFAKSSLGRLDILVNNAGVQFVSPIEDFPIDKWDQIIAINLTSAFHATRAAVPIMRAQKRGRIINIASAHALVASPFKAAYVAAKHGVLGLTKTVALEVAEAGVTCNAICPGYVHTPLVDGQIKDTAKARGMSEEQVVREVILAAQPTKQFVTFDQLNGLLLYLASDLGDFSLIWQFIGTAQGVRSDQDADASIRLGVVMLAESLLVNQGIKRLVNRPRPQPVDPRPMELRTPLTSSFPSCHASSAFTAAGILSEHDPALRPLFYGVAIVVATSRIHVQIHHASDVIAGAALGVVFAKVATRAWPLPPHGS